MKRWVASVVVAAMFAPSAAFAQESKKTDAPVADDPTVASRFPPQRYAYAGAGVFLLGGLGLSYWAQGQALRAETVSSARDAQETLQSARQSAATANLLYAMAGLTLAYGLVLEFLPPQAADKADLTFHF